MMTITARPPHWRRGILRLLLVALASAAHLWPIDARAQDLNGTWTRSDGTTVIIVQRGDGSIEGRVGTPSADSAARFGWGSGEIVMEGRIVGDKVTGSRRFRFPVTTRTRCPSVRGAAGALELRVVDANRLTSRWRNGLLEDGCRIADGGWQSEDFTRRTADARPAGTAGAGPTPAVTPATGVGGGAPPPDIDRLTTDDLSRICPDCIEAAVDFLALKETYPSVKQRLLDLTARRKALGDGAALARMRMELKDLEAELAPPEPPDFSVVRAYLETLRQGWRRHARATDAAFGDEIESLKSFLAWLVGVPQGDGWLAAREYDATVGQSLSAADRSLLEQASRAQQRLRSQLQRRKQHLVRQIAQMEELEADLARGIAEADAAVDLLEREVLQAGAGLKRCLARCRR